MSTTRRLSDISVPGLFRCIDVDGDSTAAILLKRLGICGGRSIELVQPGDPMVLRVVGARIGVSRALARSVLVAPELEPGSAGEVADGVARAVAIVPVARTEESPTLIATSRHSAAEVVSHA